jgi:hypothetical protein
MNYYTIAHNGCEIGIFLWSKLMTINEHLYVKVEGFLLQPFQYSENYQRKYTIQKVLYVWSIRGLHKNDPSCVAVS